MKSNGKSKILVLSHALGDLTHKVHLWLDGKCIVDFLLAIIELFSIALTAEALLSEKCQNWYFLKKWSLLNLSYTSNIESLRSAITNMQNVEMRNL